MNNTQNRKNRTVNNLLAFMIRAVMLVIASSLVMLMISCGGGCSGCNGDSDTDYLPKDYGNDPSGLDDEHTARY
ncbi:MAG: hypothetical protein IKB34_06745 [Clostridia bacterium]|nr:hypothetical protein [Clostridia bacterium]